MPGNAGPAGVLSYTGNVQAGNTGSAGAPIYTGFAGVSNDNGFTGALTGAQAPESEIRHSSASQHHAPLTPNRGPRHDVMGASYDDEADGANPVLIPEFMRGVVASNSVIAASHYQFKSRNAARNTFYLLSFALVVFENAFNLKFNIIG